MSVIDTLVTDRTEADVQRVKELAAKGYSNWTTAERTEWANGLKGAYNAADLNRVGQACAYIFDKLTAAGIAVPDYVALRTDWTRSNRLTPADCAQYLATVAALKAALPTVTELPATMQFMDYEDANNIEKLLAELDEILNRIASVFVRSGVYHSGTVFYIAEATT